MAFNHNMVHNNKVRFPNAIDGSVEPTNVDVKLMELWASCKS